MTISIRSKLVLLSSGCCALTFMLILAGNPAFARYNDASRLLHTRFVKTVKGTVKDQTGRALPGVTVVIEGTSKGTSSDENGNFELKDVPDNGVLVFSFIGYQTLKAPVASTAS